MCVSRDQSESLICGIVGVFANTQVMHYIQDIPH